MLLVKVGNPGHRIQLLGLALVQCRLLNPSPADLLRQGVQGAPRHVAGLGLDEAKHI